MNRGDNVFSFCNRIILEDDGDLTGEVTVEPLYNFNYYGRPVT